MTMLTEIETKLETVWHELTGEARTELQALLADAKARAAQFLPLVQAAEADVRELAASAAPEVKTALEGRLGKLVADAEELLGVTRM